VLPPDALVGLEAAVDAVHRAESAFDAGDWTRAYGPAHVALYMTERGFLPGSELRGSTRFRRDVEDLHMRALECTGAVQPQLGRNELATAEHQAAELTRLAPYRESGC
jgi:SARP family transcriptional regulator, regulator of embCAB operon